MLELYSLNIEVNENGSIPLNNISIAKGCTAIHSAPSTIQLNKSGVYMVSCNASIEPAAAGDISIQLAKNGVLQQNAQSIVTGTAGETSSLCFHTLVQVRDNNTCCCNTSPTTLQIMNTTAGDITIPIINVVVTKIC